MKIIYSLLIFTFIIPFLFCNNLINDADEETDKVKYDSFIKTVNPSTGNDMLKCIKIDEVYIYLAGYDSAPGNWQWRIEKRYKLNGNYVTSFGTDGVVQINPTANNDEITDIAIDANYIYIVGYDQVIADDKQLRMEKRDIATGDLVTAFNGDGIIDENFECDEKLSITIDTNYIYIGVTDRDVRQWRIEKRNIQTGALIASFDGDGIVESDPSVNSDKLNAIVLYDNKLYAAGNDEQQGADDQQWRIEKRDADTGALINSFGTNGVVTVNPSNYEDDIKSISVNEFGLFIAGFDISSGNNNGQWRLEKRDYIDGDLITAFSGDGIFQYDPSSDSDENEKIWSITQYGSYLYVTGGDSSPGHFQSNIQKLNYTTGEYISGFGTGGILTINNDDKLNTVFAVAADGDYLFFLCAMLNSGTDDFQTRLEKRRSNTGGF